MKKKSSLNILSGFEAKVINQDGELDISTETKNSSDLVYGAFHSWFEPTVPSKESYIATVKNMLCRKEIDVWAHPFSFSSRNQIIIEQNEIIEIVQLAKKYDILMEINLKHQTPNETVINIMLEHSVPFIISSDAHNKLDIWDKSKPSFICDKTWDILKNSLKNNSNK
jgi:histidinol phosphatase-like PHP family hydrolase